MTRAWPSCLTEAENYLVMRVACPIGDIKKKRKARRQWLYPLSSSSYALLFHKPWDSEISESCRAKSRSKQAIWEEDLDALGLFILFRPASFIMSGRGVWELTSRLVLLVVLPLTQSASYCMLSIKNIRYQCRGFFWNDSLNPSGAQIHINQFKVFHTSYKPGHAAITL